MATSTAVKRSTLRSLWRSCQKDGSQLIDALGAAEDALVKATGKGQVLQSVAGNGHTIAYEQITAGLSPQDALETVSDLLDRYDTAKAQLTEANAAAPSETAIYEEMLAGLAQLRECYSDFSRLRGEWRSAR